MSTPTAPDTPRQNQDGEYRTPRGVLIATALLAVVILLPSMAGFVNKFYEFMHASSQNADGAYVLTPMINYFFASCGFFCLLFWAALHGMFHDIEAPKQTMLAREKELDAGLTQFTPRWAGGPDQPFESLDRARPASQDEPRPTPAA